MRKDGSMERKGGRIVDIYKSMEYLYNYFFA
jgi:hypothetical protein